MRQVKKSSLGTCFNCSIRPVRDPMHDGRDDIAFVLEMPKRRRTPRRHMTNNSDRARFPTLIPSKFTSWPKGIPVLGALGPPIISCHCGEEAVNVGK
jgi:hypothetical protein